MTPPIILTSRIRKEIENGIDPRTKMIRFLISLMGIFLFLFIILLTAAYFIMKIIFEVAFAIPNSLSDAIEGNINDY